VVAVSDLEVPVDPTGATDPFHDHRWHEMAVEPDDPEVFMCDECGIVWTL
jgi:hypothetical protein